MKYVFLVGLILSNVHMLKPQTIFDIVKKTIVETHRAQAQLFDEIDTEGWHL
jgi:hypothetical protein